MTLNKPMMFTGIAGLVVVALMGLGLFAYFHEHNHVKELELQLSEAQETRAATTQYTKYLDAAKTALTEKKGELMASVVRDQTVFLRVKKSPVFRANEEVVMHLAVTYTFGFDLSPDKFTLANQPEGMAVTVGPPLLMAAPDVKVILVEVSDKSIILDEAAATAALMKDVTEDFAARGAAMASNDDVKALCEKKLIEFLRAFLLKQPDVKFLPGILVKYPAQPS